MKSTELMLLVRIGVLLFLMSPVVFAQPSPAPGKSPDHSQSAQDSSSILEYLKFLREEDKSHRDYMEELYTRTFFFAGGLGTFTVLMIGFLQLKTKRDVKKEVDSRFRTAVEDEVEARMKEFRQLMEEAARRVQDQIADVEFQLTRLLSERRPQVAPSHQPPDDSEQNILGLMDQSKYSFRSLIGIQQEATRKDMGLSANKVAELLKSLMQKGLVGKTLGKTGGERWFITESGREYLMSQQKAAVDL